MSLFEWRPRTLPAKPDQPSAGDPRPPEGGRGGSEPLPETSCPECSHDSRNDNDNDSGCAPYNPIRVLLKHAIPFLIANFEGNSHVCFLVHDI